LNIMILISETWW